jgi:hypothetical protein
MRLHLFESFAKRLDEIRFTEHWKERSSPEASQRESRIVRHSKSNPYGWEMSYVKDESGNTIENSEFLKMINFSEDVFYKLITECLYEMTRSKTLEDYIAPSGNDLMYLGKISVYIDGKYYYPFIRNFKNKEDGAGKWYPPNDGVYGLSVDNNGVTFYYLPSGPEGMGLLYKYARLVSKDSDLEFHKNTRKSYPYGENFEMVIDLTEDDLKEISAKIEMQARGETIQLGKTEKKKFVPIEKKDDNRKTIAVGSDIGVIVGYVSKDFPTMGKVDSIINILDIQKAQKIKNIPSIKEVKIGFIPKDVSAQKVTSDGRILAVPITLKPGSKILIDGNLYRLRGQEGEGSMITSEPSIIDKGMVQFWVEKV